MYLPYPGIFNKMKNVDLFVFLDDAEYSDGYYFNRNRIKGPNGEIMLSVPVIKNTGINLNQIEIAQNIHWERKHWKSLLMHYSKSNHFNEYKQFFEKIYSKRWIKLHDLNMATILYIMDQLDIKTPYYFSSDLLKNSDFKGTRRLIEICKKLNSDSYLSGISGQDYLDEKLFRKYNIRLKFQNYFPKEYLQLYGDFIPNLSIIDILFNEGDRARDFV
jgi:hypothetical protein